MHPTGGREHGIANRKTPRRCRRWFDLLCIASLSLALASLHLRLAGPTCSYKNLWTAHRADGYHMLRLDAYRGAYTLTLLEPLRPAPLSPAAQAEVNTWLPQLRNDDIEWFGGDYPVARRPAPDHLRLYVHSIFPQLLTMLADKDRFAVAHELLCGAGGDCGDERDAFAWQFGAGNYAGLQYRVNSDGTGVYDPSQIPRLREQWPRLLLAKARRIDIRLRPELFANLPLLWLAARAYRYWNLRKEQLKGMCRVCGYDLRATTERCPECGTPVPVDAEGTRV